MDRPNIPRHTVGTHDNGPLSQEYYKRAVYQSAPRCFEVDSLPPRKFGRSYRFGLRIYPILGDRVSTSSEGTTSDSTSDYEIWRSWDDCLWFQDSLELRYGVLSREKRHRLQAGKGVKKNGMYIHDRASSFESLPPGPDPRSVAKSIHGYLPKLTKRGTFFRASQETVVQRRMELDAFLEAFLRKDVPTLIQELRQDRVILDFFGYWRRDHDLATKMSAQQPAIAPGDSVGTRSLSSFFSGSIVSFPAPHTPLSPASSSSMRSASLPQPSPHSRSHSSFV
ncbi:hypothetical protein F5148DRAFT_694282 [Russula earlei]|uniref:Uncharacterized protein n=1 Tax=Russula earlei TaxID=71964 RepID=A0ACC0UE79_9AGAM|nr:hypothetical protein F5148DRAFT_694282 [Russula earlei]